MLIARRFKRPLAGNAARQTLSSQTRFHMAYKHSAHINWYVGRLTRKIRVGEKDGLYRVAGLIRRASIDTLRIKPGPSIPGKPPHAHTRGGFRLIKFFVEGWRAIIGPIKFTGKQHFSEPVPSLHEFGKTVRAYRFGRGAQYKTYDRRPFMSTALERLKSRGKIPKQFSASIGKVIR